MPVFLGATRDIGSALTRMCMRHRSIEAKLRHFTKWVIDVIMSHITFSSASPSIKSEGEKGSWPCQALIFHCPDDLTFSSINPLLKGFDGFFFFSEWIYTHIATKGLINTGNAFISTLLMHCFFDALIFQYTQCSYGETGHTTPRQDRGVEEDSCSSR